MDWWKWIQKLFGDPNERKINTIKHYIQEINSMEPDIQALTDEDLARKTVEFKDKLARARDDWERENVFNQILPEAFAVVREASIRTLGLRHFDVQLVGGIFLHRGHIAEMKTGEGKTLVASLPAYLNGLTGRGVHIVTVNDYLARRDAEQMGRIYNFLGLRTGMIQHHYSPSQRQEAYASDITYGTNNEFGFDYLRDNMATSLSDCVQRELHYAIVDEVDNILIDEARTPLIISGAIRQDARMYEELARVAQKLQRGVKNADEKDYIVDEKNKNVIISEEGIPHAEKLLSVDDLYGEEATEKQLAHHLIQALRAKELYHNEVEYMIRPDDDGIPEIVIVDEFTGRLMFGRRYSDGLHQAIEAKEGVKIRDETQTLATITLQNYFRMYKKLAGMTGTAATEEAEFGKIYNLEVTVIPTNMPMIRTDYPDLVYKNVPVKFRCVADEIEDCHRRGQPVLVGTVSIEKSEYLSKQLQQRGIPHNVLNAKYHEKEAEIIAQAGRKRAVTIATNMAGRGTDIILGGVTMDPQTHLLRKDTQEVTEYRILADIARQLESGQHYQPDAETKTVELTDVGIARSRELLKGTGLGVPAAGAFRSEEPEEVIRHLHLALEAKEFYRKGIDHVVKPGSGGPADRGPEIINLHITRYSSDMERRFPGELHLALEAREGIPITKEREVIALGGLHVLGTERHESRRIDNQLRGRCGRQGDPGTSRFYLSLEDDLMRLFGGDRIIKMMDWLKVEEDMAIEHNQVTRSIERAQQKVEKHNFDIRKQLLEYDDVMNKQREIVYRERRKILEGEDLKPTVQGMIERTVNEIAGQYVNGLVPPEEWDFKALLDVLGQYIPLLRANVTEDDLEGRGEEYVKESLVKVALELYDAKERSLIPGDEQQSAEIMRHLERQFILQMYDSKWIEHLHELDALREGIGLRAYGQKDPLLEYKRESYLAFQAMMLSIRHETASLLFHYTPHPAELFMPSVFSSMFPVEMFTNVDVEDGMGVAAPARAEKKVGRNDPCPCGSGKKYKKCHGNGGAQRMVKVPGDGEENHE